MLTRKSYLMDIDEIEPFPDSDRRAVSSSNMAYAAAAADSDRADVLEGRPQIKANIGIISSYSGKLSVHRPFSEFSKYNKNCSKKR